MAFLPAAASGLAVLLLLSLASHGPPEQGGLQPAQRGRRVLTAAPPQDIDSFVRVNAGDFVVGPECKRFFISGWNQWEAMEAAAGALELYGASLPGNTTGPALVRTLLDQARAAGLNLMRTWAHPVSPQYALMTAPGEYNEAVFRGLDYLLDEARKRGIRLMLALTDNWQPTGGADQFVSWAGSTNHEDFFSLSSTRQMYKDHVRVVLTRVNTINGRAYKDDPTIFAWDLINEPRCYQCGDRLAAWVAEMAAHVKSIDANHLLTVGEEGFYPQGLPQSATNPQGAKSWAFWEGQNFLKDHADANIDFAGAHLWIQNWEDATPTFAAQWLKQHIADARALGKPLLLKEFGAWGVDGYRAQRDDWYRLVYDTIAQDARAGGPSKGAMFWQWYADGQRAPAEEGGGAGGLFGIFESDSTWQEVKKFTGAMAALSANASRGGAVCAAHKEAGPPPARDCASTRVGGRPGTGYEGPACTVDINECARGTSGCDVNAACVNTQGGYTCACYQGFAGDGFNCAPAASLAAVAAGYYTAGGGKVACSEGADVQYPVKAPGYAYDVLQGWDKVNDSPWKGGFGSRVPVEPLGCMLACNAAPGCDSFSYNADQKRCFLKSGASTNVCSKPETLCVSARGKPYSCGFWQTYFRSVGGSAGVAATGGGGNGTAQAQPSALARAVMRSQANRNVTAFGSNP